MKSKHKALKITGIIASVIVGLVGLLILGLLLWLFLPYLGAETKLNNEMSTLHSAGEKVSQKYAGGQCLDNCPELTTTYKVNAIPLSQERTSITSLLTSNGYKISNNDNGDSITAEKGNFSITVGFNTNPFSGSQTDTIDDSTSINTLVFIMDYSPGG